MRAAALVRAVREAIDSARDRAWPYLWASLGEAYASLGERDLAIFAFHRAKETAPLWFVPRLRLSRLLMEAGQLDAAVAEAEAARVVLPHPLTQGNYLVVAAARTPSGGSVDPAIARQVTELQKINPGDEATLALYLHVLANSNRKDEARTALRDALAKEKPPALASLIGLAVASRSLGLGLENNCIDMAMKKYGMTPELAMTQASMLGPDSKPADAIELYRQAREKESKGENEVAWRLGWARLLEAVRDPGAGAAWKELGDDPALSGNVLVQKAVLGSLAAQSDRELIARTIERLKAITGEDAAVWRVARARTLLQENTPASIAQARQLLEETIRAVPTSADAHLLLGAVFESQNDLDKAIKSYIDASRLRPNPAITLQLVRLHLQRSDFGKAKELLSTLLLAQLDNAQKVQIAVFYTQLGEISRATAIIKDIGELPTDIATSLFLVQLDRRNGNLEKADARLRELLKQPSLPVIVAAAEFYALTRQPERAISIIQQLGELKLQPGEREFAEAQFHDRYGDAKLAAEKFAAAAAAMPADARTQVAYVSHLLRRGRLDDALAAAKKASAAMPSHTPLANFLKQEQSLKAVNGRPDLLALSDAILNGHADSAVAADAIYILAANRNEPPAQVVSRLRPLADRAPLLPALQSILVGGYRAMGQVAEAANIASRTARAIPNSVEFARIAAQALAETGEWTQVLAAAQAWRQLAPGDSLGADLLAAEAMLRLGNYAGATKELSPHLPAAVKDPAALGDVIRMQARILVLAGDYDRAAELLRPLLKEKPWRIYYYYLASLLIKDVDAAGKWLTELGAAIPPDQIDERVNVAGGWIDKGIKYNRDSFRNTGRDMLRNLLTSNAETVIVVYGAALFKAQEGDRKGGEEGYRKVIAMDPKHTLAMNNLAMLLAEDNRNLDEAASLVTRALEIEPNVPAFIDTLAFVEGRRKQRDNSITAIDKAIKFDPLNPLWRMRKIELLLDFGERQRASDAIAELDQLNRKGFSQELIERLQDLRKRASGTAATLPANR